MIISHSKKFIFIHNYKVAGSSIKRALRSYNSRQFLDLKNPEMGRFILGLYPKIYSKDFHIHITAQACKSKLPAKTFNQYYKFGLVRNPWDWQVSLYLFMLKEESHHQHQLIKSMKNFEEYIDWRVHEDLQLQRAFFYEKDTCLMDFIGRFENLKEDFSKICNKLSLNATLPHANQSRADNVAFKSFYSQKSIDMVYDAFIEDIKLFKYSKPIL